MVNISSCILVSQTFHILIQTKVPHLLLSLHLKAARVAYNCWIPGRGKKKLRLGIKAGRSERTWWEGGKCGEGRNRNCSFLLLFLTVAAVLEMTIRKMAIPTVLKGPKSRNEILEVILVVPCLWKIALFIVRIYWVLRNRKGLWALLGIFSAPYTHTEQGCVRLGVLQTKSHCCYPPGARSLKKKMDRAGEQICMREKSKCCRKDLSP